MNTLLKNSEFLEKLNNHFLYMFDCIDESEQLDIVELHQMLFNSDEGFIYYSDAREALSIFDLFKVINLIQDYQALHFGEINLDIKPCTVANMFFYILGEALLFEAENKLNDYENLDDLEDTDQRIKRLEDIKEACFSTISQFREPQDVLNYLANNI